MTFKNINSNFFTSNEIYRGVKFFDDLHIGCSFLFLNNVNFFQGFIVKIDQGHLIKKDLFILNLDNISKLNMEIDSNKTDIINVVAYEEMKGFGCFRKSFKLHRQNFIKFNKISVFPNLKSKEHLKRYFEENLMLNNHFVQNIKLVKKV